MKEMLWTMHRRWLQTSALQMFGVALLALVILLEVVAIRPLSAQIAAAHGAIGQLLADAQAQRTQRGLLASRKNTARAELVALLPPAQQREAEIRRMVEIAKRNGLAWTQTEYRVENAETTPAGIERVVMRYTVQGDYAALRAYLGQLLEQMPFLAIDTLSFSAAEPQLPSTLNIEASLYFRHSAGSAVAAKTRMVPPL